MRLVLASLTLLSAAALPLAASADPIDNFTLTGNGHTWTWSLPANETFADHPHLDFVAFSTTVTIDNTTQVTDTVSFYLPVGLAQSLFLPQIPDVLYGPTFTNVSDGLPGFVDVTFDTGTFNIADYHFGPTNPPDQQPPPPTPYTLVVAQQDVATTPEPSGLILLATALLALTPFVRRRIFS